MDAWVKEGEVRWGEEWFFLLLNALVVDVDVMGCALLS